MYIGQKDKANKRPAAARPKGRGAQNESHHCITGYITEVENDHHKESGSQFFYWIG